MYKKNVDFDAIIFDMDGVIFDTERMVQKSWGIVADKYGIPDIRETCMECLGMNQDATIEVFLKKYGEGFPYHEYKAEVREWFFGPLYGKHLPFKEGIPEFLEFLKNRNIPVALATSTRKDLVYKELKDAEIFCCFDQIVCGDMVKHSKPDPEIFLKACEMLNVSPNRAIVIEDSYNGIRAAFQGGLLPIMVPDLLVPTEEMKEKCINISSSIMECKEFLLRI